MRICVYGAASTKIDKKYIQATEDLCEKMALRGHTLVFGAGAGGVMGAAAKGFRKGGAPVMGVAPGFFTNGTIEEIYTGCDALVKTDSMGTRKTVMEANADAFIAGPGGIGTYDELFQVLTLKQLKIFDKPIIIFNIDHFYDPIVNLLKQGIDQKFLRSDTLSLYKVFSENEMDEMIEFIENYDMDYTKANGECVDSIYGES